jgi:hypothetical protein
MALPPAEADPWFELSFVGKASLLFQVLFCIILTGTGEVICAAEHSAKLRKKAQV